MMDLKTAAIIAAFFGVIAYLASIASGVVGMPDKEAAVAAAVRDFLGSAMDETTTKKVGDLPKVLICLTPVQSLDAERIDRMLENTIIRVVPNNSCQSTTVQGDFGMFTALTTYVGSDGREAGHLSAPRIWCPNPNNCEVDIQTHASGYRFWVKRTGSEWIVVNRRMQWVV